MCHFSLYCDVYEYGKLGISVNTSPIMALIILLFKGMYSIGNNTHVYSEAEN